MKCPKCDTTNGKTNKFCRECGTKLEEINPQAAQENGVAPDDVVLGEELYDVWKLYEAGDYDIALTNGGSILERYPDSASAHSLMALIFERKADAMVKAGDSQSARGYFKQALQHYERILDLNPGSAGDREKIASLRIKLNGVASPEPKKISAVGFKAAIKAVPTPVLAAMGTFLVILALGIIFIDLGGDDEPVRANAKKDDAPRLETPSSINPPRAADSTLSSGTATTPSAPLQVYRFPEQSSGGSRQAPAPPRPNPIQGGSREIPEIEPEKLPGLTLPLEVKPKKPAATVQEVKPAKVELPKLETVHQPEPATTPKADDGTAATKESSEKQAPRVTGASLLAQAIESSRQGLYDDAIKQAQQAIGLFESDIDSGRNVDAANRGIKNAKNLIRVWQQSSGSN